MLRMHTPRHNYTNSAVAVESKVCNNAAILQTVQWLEIMQTSLRVPTTFCTGYVNPVDKGLQLGDYPQLPWKSAQENAPKGWWDDQDRRDKETLVSCLFVV